MIFFQDAALLLLPCFIDREWLSAKDEQPLMADGKHCFLLTDRSSAAFIPDIPCQELVSTLSGCRHIIVPIFRDIAIFALYSQIHTLIIGIFSITADEIDQISDREILASVVIAHIRIWRRCEKHPGFVASHQSGNILFAGAVATEQCMFAQLINVTSLAHTLLRHVRNLIRIGLSGFNGIDIIRIQQPLQL